MEKDTTKNIEISDKFINELAEKRTIELLRMSEDDFLTAKAFETTKVVEIIKIKKELKVNCCTSFTS